MCGIDFFVGCDYYRTMDQYVYTSGALKSRQIVGEINVEPDETVRAVIEGRVNYDSLHFDPMNEIAKGIAWVKQQDIILGQDGKDLPDFRKITRFDNLINGLWL